MNPYGPLHYYWLTLPVLQTQYTSQPFQSKILKVLTALLYLPLHRPLFTHPLRLQTLSVLDRTLCNLKAHDGTGPRRLLS